MPIPAFLRAPVRVLSAPFQRPDPLVATLLIVAAFFVLGLCRIGIPSKMMFDEIHYVPAARRNAATRGVVLLRCVLEVDAASNGVGSVYAFGVPQQMVSAVLESRR